MVTGGRHVGLLSVRQSPTESASCTVFFFASGCVGNITAPLDTDTCLRR